jgi:hypothetical protein
MLLLLSVITSPAANDANTCQVNILPLLEVVVCIDPCDPAICVAVPLVVFTAQALHLVASLE